MVNPTKIHSKAENHVLRYLRGATYFWLWYRRVDGVKLQGFTDANWVRIPSDVKIILGAIFSVGSITIT